MKIAPPIVAAAILLSSGASLAETLAQAWDSALASHRQIKAAAALRDAAEFELARARATRLPQFGLTSGYTQLDSAPAFSFGDGLTTPPIFEGDNFLQAGAEMILPIYSGGAISAGIESAASGAGAAAGQLEAVTQDIRLGVAEHYVGVLRAERALAVAQSLVASLATHTEDTKKRYEFGAVAQNDYLAASVTLADAKQRLLQAENALDHARAAYNRYLDRPLDSPVSLDPTLAIEGFVPAGRSVGELTALAVRERPELATMTLQVEALRGQSQAARASTRPQLALTGGYVFLENRFLDDDAFWMAGVSLNWNLFDGGRASKQAAAIDSRASAIGYRRGDMESTIALQVRRASNDRRAAESRVLVAEGAVVQAEENLRVVRNRYAAGASTNVEVLDAEALREQSLSNRDNARFELELAKLRLARAIGRL